MIRPQCLGSFPGLCFGMRPRVSYVIPELVCFDVVVQTQLLTGYMEIAIFICKVITSVVEAEGFTQIKCYMVFIQ